MADVIHTIALANAPLGSSAGAGTLRQRRPTLHEFITGPENRLLEGALRLVMDSALGTFHPLVLHGPSGTGKSHLARGLAARWREQAGVPVAECDAQQFAEEFRQCAQSRSLDTMRSRYSTSGILILENLHQLPQSRAVQDELSRLLDAFERSGGQLTITSRIAPWTIANLLPGLRSRLSAGLAVPVARPGGAARRALVDALARLYDISISCEVAAMLADADADSANDLLGTLIYLDMSLGCCQRTIDADIAAEYLDSARPRRQPDLRAIMTRTARQFSLSVGDLKGRSRRQSVARARGIAMWLARELTDHSLSEIGAYCGGRDHTTVLHGCRRSAEMLQIDATLRLSVEELRRTLGDRFRGVDNVSNSCPPACQSTGRVE